MVDFRYIAGAALAQADILLAAWLPGGEYEGDEYVVSNPTRNDHSAHSFKANRRNGKWADFAKGHRGGDLISLYGYLNGLRNGEAARRLAADLGLNGNGHTGPHVTSESKEGVTLEALANAKGLPIEVLRRDGFSQAGSVVKITYLKRDGTPQPRCRYRVRLKGPNKYKWDRQKGLPCGNYLRNTLEAGPDKILFLVEGETDAVTLRLHRFQVLGVPGASCAKFLEADDLAGFDTVAILREPDQGGPTFEAGLIKRLGELKYSGTVKVVTMPVAAKDANELHLKTLGDPGGFEAELNALIDEAQTVHPFAVLTGESARDGNPDIVGDLAVADRIHAQHGNDILYCPAYGFSLWDARRWAPDQREAVYKLAEETVRSIYAEAAVATDPKRKAELLRLAKSHSRAERIRGATTVFRTRVAVAIEDLDRDPFALNVQNGTLDLRRRKLRPHHRDGKNTKLIDIPYDPEAKAPRWKRFLLEIFDGDAALERYAQRAVGYSLTADQREQVFFFLWGAGSNGKSTFVAIILSIAGEYGQVAPASLFLQNRPGAIPVDEARLRGARFVATSETAESRHLDEEKIKKLTGNERIVARFMRQNLFEFDPTHHLWLSSNYRPRISGTDYAIWRRVKLIPFTVKFEESTAENPQPKHARDLGLKNALMAELPGVLAWAVEGARCWYEYGLDEPEVVKTATREYQREEDLLQSFLDDRCMVSQGMEASATALYLAYKNWMEGERRIWSKKEFAMRLRDRGFEKKHSRIGTVYLGLALADSEQHDASA